MCNYSISRHLWCIGDVENVIKQIQSQKGKAIVVADILSLTIIKSTR